MKMKVAKNSGLDYNTHSKPDQGDGVTWSDHDWDKVYCSSMTKRNGMCFSKQ